MHLLFQLNHHKFFEQTRLDFFLRVMQLISWTYVHWIAAAAAIGKHTASTGYQYSECIKRSLKFWDENEKVPEKVFLL